MTSSTCLKPWPPDLPTIDKAIRFRDHLVDHLAWIAEHRSGNQQYQRIAETYKRQVVATSQLIARLNAETRRRASVSRDTAQAA